MVKVFVCIILSFIYPVFLSVDLLTNENYSPIFTKDDLSNDTRLPFIESSSKPKKNPCNDPWCPSQTYIPNDKYLKANPDPFPLYSKASEDIFQNLSSQEYGPRCTPNTFGYDPKYAETIFPTKSFPKCQNTKKSIIHIDQKTNKLYMDCENGEYYKGVNVEDELIGYSQYKTKGQSYKNPVELDEDIEWAYGNCEKSQYPAQAATYILKKNINSEEYAKVKMQKMQEKMFNTYKSSETTPLTVLMISIDSMSRKHFYRKLPLTLKYLKSLNKNSYRVYDFKLHNIVGDNSIPNVYTILTGQSYPYLSSYEEDQNIKAKDDLIRDISIWTYLREKGWVSLFGTEFCNDYFSYGLGRKPSVDHLSAKFWCAGKVLSGYRDLSEKQRCIGAYNSHYYLLNYTYQFTQEYQGVNKWAHIMILPAHEDSGTVVSSLDEDFVEFLDKFLNSKDKTIVFILADHGPRYGDWKKTLEGAEEHKLPVLFMIAPTELLLKIPFSFDTLEHNTQRLVTKFDIHLTLKHIAYLPYYMNFTKESYENIEWNDGVENAHSLMIEKIPDGKTCEYAKIRSLWCPCNVYKEVDLDMMSEFTEKIIKVFIDGIVDQINVEGYSNYRYYAWKICRRVTFKKLVDVEILQIGSFRQHFRLRMILEESPDVIVESEVVFTLNHLLQKPARQFYGFRNFYIGKKFLYHIKYIRIVAGLDPVCETATLAFGIYPGICLCKNLNEIHYNTGLDLLSNTIYKVSELGQNCTTACNNINKKCSALIMNNMNCDMIKRYSYCDSCNDNNDNLGPGFYDSKCFITGRSSCDSSSQTFYRLCGCV